MVYNILTGFEEFKNTTEGKKLEDNVSEEPCLRFRKTFTGAKRVPTVIIIFNKPLLRSMKDNNVITFKMLFNELNNKVAIRFDNSKNAMTLVNRHTRENGTIMISDKYVTATILPLFKDKKALTYKCKFIKDQLIYLFEPMR